MAVRLTKDQIGKLPEYTPVHLIDEEDTIVRAKSTTEPTSTSADASYAAMAVNTPDGGYDGDNIDAVDAQVLYAPHGELGTVLTIEKRKEALLSEVRRLSPDAQITFCEQAIEELKDVRAKARETQNPLLANLGMILLRFGLAVVLTGSFALFGEPVKAMLMEMLGEDGAMLYTVSHIAATCAAFALCGASVMQTLRLTIPAMSVLNQKDYKDGSSNRN